MPSLPRLKALAVSLAPIVVLVTMTACQATVAPAPKPELRFMTYNVYVGAAPDELLDVESALEVPPKVAKFYRDYQASDFPRTRGGDCEDHQGIQAPRHRAAGDLTGSHPRSR